NEHGCTVYLEQARFSQFDAVLRRLGFSAVDGLLLDLGVSSHQLDEGQRGFSYRVDAPLDMRMDQSQGTSAAELLNNSLSDEIAEMLSTYGDVTGAGPLADAFVRFRATRPFQRTGDIAESLKPIFGQKLSYDLLARIFQALRIAVNDELQELRLCLEKTVDHIKAGGRLAVIAYHSGEDRIVKDFFRLQEKKCICSLQMPQCVCGGRNQKFKRVNRKALKPVEAEIGCNPRSRSARLRIGERSGESL
ncbi:MAG: 16S rRNA (cytosine(1402)-N(4))-methyltransferase RsmH, partial [Chitinivibrionales bacterium]|nr:16S rRNA (cytosine(1402)-N(4))-methyltransferase RsmH [Chitinivibrionales bacterium]